MGKSTLLNALIGFKSHTTEASVSPKPGETKQLQFYSVGFKKSLNKAALVVCDMPGYGFAYMSEAEAKRCDELVLFKIDLVFIFLFKNLSHSQCNICYYEDQV